MKCPKCGYLGFETTDRCRNCQYDFSLAPFTPDPELALQDSHRASESNADFDLPPLRRQPESLSTNALDLDRLFGSAEPAAPLPAQVAARPEPPSPADGDDDGADEEVPVAEPTPAPAMQMADHDSRALPFDDAPLVPPPAARPPLAVRRATPEMPRNRPRTTRPVRTEPLALEPETPVVANGRGGSAAETVASLMEMPPLAVRVGAGLIDVLLLSAISLVVLYLTLRIAGLQNTLEDLRVLPPIPFAGFLGLLAFGYVAVFTVAGGQTIGKMLMHLRVIGDDGRPVDAAGGMLRALGCMMVPITLGLSYVPALVTSDQRALHDRLAGTRVVRE